MKVLLNGKIKPLELVENPTNELCYFGCGQIGKYQYQNGHWCCSDKWERCPQKRKERCESSSGRIKTEEERLNLSKALNGKPKPKGFGKKISKALKGRSYEDLHGKEEADRIKSVLSEIGKTLTGEKNPGWKGGISFEPHSPDFNKKLKEKIRKRDNYICQLCGIEEYEHIVGEKQQKLVVHHIDYDKKNSNEFNLITLCRRCNAKVNGEREYWTKYFKERIKIKYFVNNIIFRSILRQSQNKVLNECTS